MEKELKARKENPKVIRKRKAEAFSDIDREYENPKRELLIKDLKSQVADMLRGEYSRLLFAKKNSVKEDLSAT